MKKKVFSLIAVLMIMISGVIFNLNLISKDNLSSLALSNIEALATEDDIVLVGYVPTTSTCIVYVEGECNVVIWIPSLGLYCELNMNYSYSYIGFQVTCSWTGNSNNICLPHDCR